MWITRELSTILKNALRMLISPVIPAQTEHAKTTKILRQKQENVFHIQSTLSTNRRNYEI
jgi:hypothetical protein